MNFLNRILQYIERKRALKEFNQDLKKLSPVSVERRIQIFNEIVTPSFQDIGLNNWDGKYIWFSDFNEQGIKFVIEYQTNKTGFGSSFFFGICYDFIPVISNNKFIYHKTGKSTKIIYLKLFDSMEKHIIQQGSSINYDNISLINEERFRKDLSRVIENNYTKLKFWFKNNESIDQNIGSLLSEYYSANYAINKYRQISIEYILGFLYFKKNEIDNARLWINMFLKNSKNSEKEKIILDNIFDLEHL